MPGFQSFFSFFALFCNDQISHKRHPLYTKESHIFVYRCLYFHAIHWPHFVSFLRRGLIFLSTVVYIFLFSGYPLTCFVSFLLKGSDIFVYRCLYFVFSGYPLALFHRYFLYGSSETLQNIYFTLSGLGICYFNFGK